MTEQTKYICKHDRLWRSCNECYLEDEIRRLRELNERLKEGYKKILEYPLTGAEYADIAEAMRYRQIARSALGEVEQLEKGQTTNDPAGHE